MKVSSASLLCRPRRIETGSAPWWRRHRNIRIAARERFDLTRRSLDPFVKPAPVPGQVLDDADHAWRQDVTPRGEDTRQLGEQPMACSYPLAPPASLRPNRRQEHGRIISLADIAHLVGPRLFMSSQLRELPATTLMRVVACEALVR